MFASNCPRCHNGISEERARQTPLICDHCGFVISNHEQEAQAQLQKSYKWGLTAFSAAVVIGYMSIATWGGYTFEMRWLQLGELTGMNSPASTERIAQICLETFRYDCTEEMYGRLAGKDPAWAVKLGKFQMSRQNYKAAANTFARLIAASPTVDPDIAFLYARSLGHIGQVDEASMYFEQILKAKPDVLQVTVIQRYVELLVNAQRLDDARRVIEQIRKKDESLSAFMDREYRDITEKLGGARG